MNILIIEPYFTGSHKSWAEGFQANSRHQVDLLTMKGQFWKWRMHGGAITLAKEFLSMGNIPDLILASDMIDLTTFLALTKKVTAHIPTAIYFHENQISYPWSSTDRDVQEKRDKHYGFINIASSLSADHIFFNSNYHKQSFLAGAKKLLKHFPDYNELESIERIKNKSTVLPLGLDLKKFDPFRSIRKNRPPLIIWNHRWEYDKNPEDFFMALFVLAEKSVNFEVAILGENFNKAPRIFEEAKSRLGSKILHYGYCNEFEDYARWLWRADILPITSVQDFFGISIMEAVYCNTFPVLPRRLTYPELFPDTVLYNDFEDLVLRMEKIFHSFDATPPSPLSTYVKKYDWTSMAPVYDDEIDKLIETFSFRGLRKKN